MTTNRAHPIASAAAVIRQTFGAPPDSTAGVVAGLATIATAFWNLPVVLLLILVVAAGMIDIWTGSRRARIRKRLGLPGGFDRARLDDGVSGKSAVLVAILFLGLALDSIGSLVGGLGSLGFSGLFQTYTPAMVGLLAYRLVREASSVMENLEGTPGSEGAIWPGVGKFIDALRARLVGAEPDKRWGDHVKPEERAWMDRQLDIKRNGGTDG